MAGGRSLSIAGEGGAEEFPQLAEVLQLRPRQARLQGLDHTIAN